MHCSHMCVSAKEETIEAMMPSMSSTSNYRYERKFLVSYLNKHETESIIRLHPAMFSEIHYQRFVNNIYFDTVNASNYFDNIVGSSKRHKIRIRWYGDLFGFIDEPVLEVKIKNGFLGSKMRFLLKPFNLDTGYTLEAQRDLFAQSFIQSPTVNEELYSLQPTLLNRYSRRYFESADHKFRITIDSDMEFFRIHSCNNSFAEKAIDYNNTILELKYSDKDDEEARFITNCLPFRMTRSSKYTTGIERLQPLV